MLSEHVNDLTALAPLSYEEYAENRILRGYVERTLQICAQICLDIGGHLIAELALRAPADSRDIFAVLHEEGIIPDVLLSDLARMVGFRNVIVHDYARIDDGLVYTVLQENVSDFARFAAAVIAFLEREGLH
jgi:uncharacterized protein YutE (UPF0331/DUF86 family)